MTSKQKNILLNLKLLKENISITSFVLKLSQNLDCSKTAIWNNLKQLKKIGLIDYGDSKTKGAPIALTKEGKLILKNIERE